MSVQCPWQGKPDCWRRTWAVAGPGGDYYIVQRQDLRPCEQPLPVSMAEAIVDRMVGESASRPTVLELYRVAGGADLAQRHRLDDAGVRNALRLRLRQAFERGELHLCRMPVLTGSSAQLEEEGTQESRQAAGAPPRESRRRAWIEVRLVDMEGNAVPNKHYLVKCPDGHTEEGFLDGSGRIRLDNLDPGNCTISFPDLDQEAWEAAPE